MDNKAPPKNEKKEATRIADSHPFALSQFL
jgi:hypothetical protein